MEKTNFSKNNRGQVKFSYINFPNLPCLLLQLLVFYRIVSVLTEASVTTKYTIGFVWTVSESCPASYSSLAGGDYIWIIHIPLNECPSYDTMIHNNIIQNNHAALLLWQRQVTHFYVSDRERTYIATSFHYTWLTIKFYSALLNCVRCYRVLSNRWDKSGFWDFYNSVEERADWGLCQYI